MNKTLLLILVDFLLLTILSMWKSEDESEAAAPAAGELEMEQGLSSMAVMEQDLLDTLQFSLEEEQSQREDLAEDLSQRAEELEMTKAELEAREERIQNLQEEMTEAERRELALQQERERLARESEELAEEVAAKEQNIAQVQARLQTTELEAQQNAAQSRLLQEELEAKLEAIAEKEAALEQTNRQLSQAQSQVQELDMQVKMSAQENEFLKESVTTLRSEVEAERIERSKIQEQAGKLAEGVTQLAENSQDLREELRSNIPINANQLFSAFKENKLEGRFRSVVYQRGRYVETEDSFSTVVVSDGRKTFAILHVSSGPFDLNSRIGLIRSIELSLRRGGNRIEPSTLNFLSLDPRVLAVELSEEQVELLGGDIYYTAIDPYKWEKAVLVQKDGDRYGEVDFKLEPDMSGFVKMQSKVLSSLFGEFSPSTGDLVFSKTGELLGMMVNRRYCVVINNFVMEESVEIGGVLNEDRMENVLESQRNLLRTYPSAIR